MESAFSRWLPSQRYLAYPLLDVTLQIQARRTAESPLELVQIDHTQSDVVLVDERWRKPIGRPWLSLAIDVATRCVMFLLMPASAAKLRTLQWVCLAGRVCST